MGPGDVTFSVIIIILLLVISITFAIYWWPYRNAACAINPTYSNTKICIINNRK